MRTGKVIRNYIYNTAYQLLTLLSPLITAPYVSRVLGASGVGIYSYTQSIATYFVLIGAVGTTLYGQREIAYVQDDPQKRSELFWQITLFRFCTVFICAVIYFCVFAIHGTYSVIYQILTFEVLATAVDISWFFIGMENFRVTVIRNTIIKLLGIIAVFIFVNDENDVPAYTLCMTLPIFIGNISLWISMPKYLIKVKIKISDIIKHIKPALILFIPQLATEVYTVLDKTMLGIFATDMAEVGYYTQGSRIIKVVLRIITSLGTVMLPAMSFAFAKGEMETIKKSIKQAFQFVFMIGFALLFGVCGIAENFVPLFFGPGFERVTILMIIISPILILIGMSNIIGQQYLLPTKQQTAYTTSVVVGSCVNFILNIILITKYNAIGASIATVAAELSVTSVQMVFVRKQLNFKDCLSPMGKYFICGLIMGLSVYTVGRILGGGWSVVILQVLIGIVIYLIELVLTKDAMLKIGFNILKQRFVKKEND